MTEAVGELPEFERDRKRIPNWVSGASVQFSTRLFNGPPGAMGEEQHSGPGSAMGWTMGSEPGDSQLVTGEFDEEGTFVGHPVATGLGRERAGFQGHRIALSVGEPRQSPVREGGFWLKVLQPSWGFSPILRKRDVRNYLKLWEERTALPEPERLTRSDIDFAKKVAEVRLPEKGQPYLFDDDD